jgi:hypothetical protein
MTRFSSLDNLVRIFITGLLLITVFGLARSSPSALRSYEGPALTDAPTLKGVPTPSVARLLVAPGARLIAGPAISTFHWPDLVDGTVRLGRLPAQTKDQTNEESGPTVRGPAVQVPALPTEDNGPKAHGRSAE